MRILPENEFILPSLDWKQYLDLKLNVRTEGKHNKSCLGKVCIMLQNMLIAIYYRVICNYNYKFILFGTKLPIVPFMFSWCLAAWDALIVITQHIQYVASYFSLSVSPDDFSHCSSCLPGYYSTVLARLRMSALGLH